MNETHTNVSRFNLRLHCPGKTGQRHAQSPSSQSPLTWSVAVSLPSRARLALTHSGYALSVASQPVCGSVLAVHAVKYKISSEGKSRDLLSHSHTDYVQ